MSKSISLSKDLEKDPEGIKIKEMDSVLGIHHCYKCKSSTIESATSCSNPDCNIVFSKTKIECPYCNELHGTNKEKCSCGFDFIKYIQTEKKKEAISTEPEKESKKEKILSTKWLSFVNYCLFPLLLLQNIVADISTVDLGISVGSYIYSILSLINYSILLPLIFGLHKRESWAFILYIIYAIYYPLSYLFHRANIAYYLTGDSGYYTTNVVLGIIIYMLIYTLPNIVYIIKRKKLFIVSTIKESSDQSKTTSKIIPKKEGTDVKDDIDTIEKLNKIAELKDNGVITVEEFEEKKKELLDRL